MWSGGKVVEWYSLCKYITNWILISICLLIQRDFSRTTRNRPPVFVYLCKLLVVPCTVRLNIQYLFVYLFKSMSTKAHASDHLYLFIYANYLLFHVLFVWILISICLLIQNNVNRTTPSDHLYLFIYANYLLFHVLFVWILISICLLIQNNVNKSLRSSLARSI